MIVIEQLLDLSLADARRLIYGYTSHRQYAARKVETPGSTHISLELTPFEEPYTRRWVPTQDELERYREYLRAGLSLAAYDQEQMVALAITEPRHWNKTLWLWEFHVLENHRGQGLGKALMEALAQKAQAAGFYSLGLETQNTNYPAISFYRQVGFHIAGIDLSLYAGTDAPQGEVAVYMKRMLLQQPQEV